MRGLYVGVPVIIGGKGIERIIEINLNVGEKKAFKKSVAAVRTLVNVVKRIQKKSKKVPARKKPAPKKTESKKKYF